MGETSYGRSRNLSVNWEFSKNTTANSRKKLVTDN